MSSQQSSSISVPYVVNRSSVSPRDTGYGERVYELAGTENGNLHKHCIGIVDIDPGKSSRIHYHPSVEETYFVLQGQALINIDGAEAIINSGDLITIPTSSHHKVTSLSDSEILQLYVTCA